eukprot:UN03536
MNDAKSKPPFFYEICRHFVGKTHGCRLGDKCTFAHPPSDFRKYRKKLDNVKHNSSSYYSLRPDSFRSRHHHSYHGSSSYSSNKYSSSSRHNSDHYDSSYNKHKSSSSSKNTTIPDLEVKYMNLEESEQNIKAT